MALRSLRPTLSVAVAGAVMASLAVMAAQPSVGAEPPVSATISSIKNTDGTVSGVLTVRSGTNAPVEPSINAFIGGQKLPVTVTPVQRGKRAAMLVVDTSGSMGEAGMSTVRSAVGAFLRDAPADVAVGLVSFAGTAGVDVVPTLQRARIQDAVNGLKSRGETTLYDAVALAASSLEGYDERSIILLSDGGDTRSTKATRASATAALTRAGVRAEVVGFKTGESDNSVLTGFARAGGGSVAAAGNSAAVQAAFEAAAKALDSQVTFSIATHGLSGVQPLVISGRVAGRSFTARATTNFAAPPVPSAVPATPAPDLASPPARLAPVKAQLPLKVWIGAGALLFGLLAGSIVLFVPTANDKRRERAQTIERYVAPSVATPVQVAKASPSAISTQLVTIGDRIMEGKESTGRTMALMERADLPLRAGEWWVLRIVALVVGPALVLVLFHRGIGLMIFATMLGLAAGYFLPAIVLRFLARRRAKKFEAQLPDVLTLVASSLSTGFSLPQALDAVAKDAAQPAAKEFSRALAETRIGSDISDALERMAARMDSDNMRWTTMAIRIQREVGGNLADTLRTTAKTLREREELQRHVRALSAEGRLSAYILIGLPIGLFFYEMKTNYDYISLLWTRGLGVVMLAMAAVSLTIGIFWMRKTVDVKV